MSLAILIFILCFTSWGNTQEEINVRPIIGIITQELKNSSSIAQNATSQIYASYVKFIESAGARVVPIWIKQPVKYYRDLLGKINGVLFPGGGVALNGAGYGRTGKIIFEIATQMNDEGDYFPLWGTCLGFELMSLLVAKKDLRKACLAQDLPTNLTFTTGFKTSRMFKELDKKLENSMKNQNIAIHYHQWCLTPQNFSTFGLDKYFKTLALNQDSRNITFVSIIEALNYPYYGVAFHPEKIVFEWPMTKTHQKIPHSLEAIKVSQYFGNFFVNEARRNKHRFSSKEMENSVLIYNYNPVFTGKIKNNPTVQKYYFQ